MYDSETSVVFYLVCFFYQCSHCYALLYNQELDRGLEKAILKEKEDMANGRLKGEAGKRAQRKAPKNGRKINKKEENSEAVTETLETEFSSAMETGDLVILSNISNA